VAPTEALSPAEERAKFKLPAGFEIQLVASEPTIQKPMNIAFDDRGRLWVTHSVEYPFAPADPTTARDGLTVLESFGPDGLATKSTLFADGLNIPIGILPLPSGTSEGVTEVIVWSIPNIWKLTDTDADGKADRREVLYGPFDFVDTHGDQNAFRLAPDGWVYACHGFRNTSKVKLRGEGPVVLEMNSGNTYRFRPDGSAIEQVSWGQVNPFGMCFDSLGNQFTADCHSKPLTMVLRGGCYEQFGKPHDGLGFAPLTTGNDHGSTGIAGVAVSESAGFPRDYQGSMFVGNVITNTIHRDVVEWRGSSPWVEKPTDFLTCDDWWFRPVDLQMGPDGGLYVADFYNCIIGHYEVDLKHPRRDRNRGRIWRIVWKGDAAAPPATVPPDLTVLDDEQLVARLGDANQTVRRLAFDLVIARAQRDPQANSTIASLLKRSLEGPVTDVGVHQRPLAVHGLARLGQLDGGMAARLANDPSRLVRVHLVKALAAMPGWDTGRGDLVRARLDDADPFVRRAAATALGEHPEVVSIAPLLHAAASVPENDTQLLHALRIALRNQLRVASPENLAGLSLDAADWRRLIDVANAVPDASLAWFVFGYVRSHEVPQDLKARCLASVGQHCGDERIEEAVAYARQTHANDPAGETSALQSLFDGLTRRSRKLSAPDALGKWAAAVATRILTAPSASASTPGTLSLALTVADQLSLSPLADPVFRLLADPQVPLDVRRVAASTAITLDRPRACSALEAIVLDGSETVAVRQTVARLLGSEAAPSARDALARAMATAPASLAQPLAMALASTPEGAETLLSLAASGKASPRLLQNRPVVERLKASAVPDVDRRVEELTRGLPTPDDALKQLMGRVATGYATAAPSAENGAAFFRKACANCHRLGGEGGKIGPQLDGVGQRGIDRLLEDILDPNRNVDEAFRTTTVTTADGRVVSGLKLRDEGSDLVLADTTGQEVRIAAADIDETVISPLSPMPSNVVDQIGEENLPHLLRYLIESRSSPRP
jgi:putative heme-binding domain-containing protein